MGDADGGTSISITQRIGQGDRLQDCNGLAWLQLSSREAVPEYPCGPGSLQARPRLTGAPMIDLHSVAEIMG